MSRASLKVKGAITFIETQMLPTMDPVPGAERVCAANGEPYRILPTCHNWAQWYELYLLWCKETDFCSATVARSTFYYVVRHLYPHLKIGDTSTHIKCDTCEQLKVDRARATTEEEQKAVCKRSAIHTAEQERERSCYDRVKVLAREHPERCLSIILDGASKVPFPATSVHTHRMDECRKLKLDVFGLINHGAHANEIYLSLNQWEANQDMVLSVATQHIRRYFIESGLHPSELLMQVDNCCPLNKNKYVLAWAAMLIRMGWFKKIYISYLLPGHTHCDVDQLFCNLHWLITNIPIFTLGEYYEMLVNLWKTAKTRQKFRVFVLNTVYGWKDWFGDLVYDAHHLDTCQGFRFKEFVHADNIAVIGVQGRALNASDSWQEPREILAAWPEADIPYAQPNLAMFDEETIDKVLSVFYEQMTREDIEWWTLLKNDPRKALQLPASRDKVSLSNFIAIAAL